MKILLDAGHDGKRNRSPCKTDPVYYESVAMWKLQEHLAEALTSLGITVGKTRESLYEIMDVNTRGALAGGYDLFISLHTNAAGGGVKEGTDRPAVIYPVGAGSEQIKLADALAACAERTIGTRQAPKNYSRSYKSDPNIDYFGVIRSAVSAGCASAFIFEISFHTDTRTTLWLLSEDNLKKLAVAIAEEIASFYGIEKKIPTPFLVRVGEEGVAIRRGPGSNYADSGKRAGKGVYTVVEVSAGEGSEKGWGRLKSGSGWVSLDAAEFYRAL